MAPARAPPSGEPGRHSGLSAEGIVRWAVQCLYMDEAPAHGPLLQWTIQNIAGAKLNHVQLRKIIQDTPGLRVEPQTAKKFNFHAVLDVEPTGFQGFGRDDDVVESVEGGVWEEACERVKRGGWPKAEEASHKYFVVAAWLQDKSPTIGKMSFGRILSLLRVMGQQDRKLLGHRLGILVPYEESEEHEREMNAVYGRPTDVGPNEDYVKTWEELREKLRVLLAQQADHTIEVSRVKLMFRNALRIELSETVFGHQCLSKLLADQQLGEDFAFETREGNFNRCVLRLRGPPAA